MSHWLTRPSNLYLIEAGNDLIKNAIAYRSFIEHVRLTNELIFILDWPLIFGIIFYVHFRNLNTSYANT